MKSLAFRPGSSRGCASHVPCYASRSPPRARPRNVYIALSTAVRLVCSSGHNNCGERALRFRSRAIRGCKQRSPFRRRFRQRRIRSAAAVRAARLVSAVAAEVATFALDMQDLQFREAVILASGPVAAGSLVLRAWPRTACGGGGRFLGTGLFAQKSANAPPQILALQTFERSCAAAGLVEQPTIGPPMHAWRLLRKRVEEVRPAAQPHAKLPRFPYGAIARALGLARIGQPTAAAARKERAVAASAQLRDAPAAAFATTWVCSVIWRTMTMSNPRPPTYLGASGGHMPPPSDGGPWPAAQIELFRTWISEGCRP